MLDFERHTEARDSEKNVIDRFLQLHRGLQRNELILRASPWASVDFNSLITCGKFIFWDFYQFLNFRTFSRICKIMYTKWCLEDKRPKVLECDYKIIYFNGLNKNTIDMVNLFTGWRVKLVIPGSNITQHQHLS